jgi:hypothetical protein
MSTDRSGSISPRRRILRSSDRVFMTFAAVAGLICSSGCEQNARMPTFGLIVARNVADADLFQDWSPLEFRLCPVRQDLDIVAYRSPWGSVAEFWIQPDSRLEIVAVPREILLTEHPASREDVPGDEIVAARARFGPEDQEALAAYRNEYRHCTILISLDGEITWVATNDSDWTREIPIGLFRKHSSIYDKLVSSDAEIEWVGWPALEEALRMTEESDRRALQMLACDPDFREQFERQHPGTLEGLAEQIESIECDDTE